MSDGDGKQTGSLRILCRLQIPPQSQQGKQSRVYCLPCTLSMMPSAAALIFSKLRCRPSRHQISHTSDEDHETDSILTWNQSLELRLPRARFLQTEMLCVALTWESIAVYRVQKIEHLPLKPQVGAGRRLLISFWSLESQSSAGFRKIPKSGPMLKHLNWIVPWRYCKDRAIESNHGQSRGPLVGTGFSSLATLEGRCSATSLVNTPPLIILLQLEVLPPPTTTTSTRLMAT